MLGNLLRRSTLAICVALVFLLSSPAFADVDASTIAAAEELLGGIDTVASPAEIAAFGPDGAAAFAAIATDTTRRATERARATTALVQFDDPVSVATLQGLLADADAPAILHRKAIWALATLAPAQSIDQIAAHLDAADVSTREVAIKTLVATGDSRALGLVRNQLDREPSEYLQGLISEVIVANPQAVPGIDVPGPKE